MRRSTDVGGRLVNGIEPRVGVPGAASAKQQIAPSRPRPWMTLELLHAAWKSPSYDVNEASLETAVIGRRIPRLRLANELCAVQKFTQHSARMAAAMGSLDRAQDSQR